MKIGYFGDTDTLLLTFNDRTVADTRDINEDTLVELDAEGRLVSITIEHAKTHTDLRRIARAGARATSPRLAPVRNRPRKGTG